mgnify:CR=1 FL=1
MTLIPTPRLQRSNRRSKILALPLGFHRNLPYNADEASGERGLSRNPDKRGTIPPRLSELSYKGPPVLGMSGIFGDFRALSSRAKLEDTFPITFCVRSVVQTKPDRRSNCATTKRRP